MKDNNSVKTKVRIADEKIKVLVIEEQPNWTSSILCRCWDAIAGSN